MEGTLYTTAVYGLVRGITELMFLQITHLLIAFHGQIRRQGCEAELRSIQWKASPC